MNRFAVLSSLLLFPLAQIVADDNMVDPDAPVVAVQRTSKGEPNTLLPTEQQGMSELVTNINDADLGTKFLARVSDDGRPGGLNAGFVIAPRVGPNKLTGIRFATGNDMPDRDPATITIEGSNDPKALAEGSGGFTLIYEGPAGLDNDPGRGNWGETVAVKSPRLFRFYRVLVTGKRGDAGEVQFADVELIGQPEKPGVLLPVPALTRFRINDQWSDRTQLQGPPVQGPANPLASWYRKPAEIWEAALPIGNGSLGGMVFGGVSDERIQLNVDSLWDGYPRNPQNTAALEALSEVRRLLFEGKNREAEAIAAKAMLGDPHGVLPYQSLGELWMEFDGVPTATNYLRQLDMTTAITSVQYASGGRKFYREAFSSAPAGVIVARYAADKPGSITARMTLKRQKDAKCIPHPNDPASILLDGVVERTDKEGRPRGMRFAAQVKAIVEGGSVTNTGGVLMITKANSVTLFIAGATSYPGMPEMAELLAEDALGNNYLPDTQGLPDPIALCGKAIAGATASTYDTLRAAHVKDYQSYFNRVSLELGPANAEAAKLPTDERIAALKSGDDDPGLVSLYFAFGRYLLISSSRPGTLPANLQGIWAWQMNPPWNADFHTNINLQMNYWPAEPTNLAELQFPIFDLMDILSASGASVAKTQYDAGGWVVHHLTDPFGFAAPADFLGGVWPMGAAWLARHPWEHYEYSGDKEFLRDRAWPLMKGAAEFMLDFLVEAPAGTPVAGKLVTNPSYSPENEFFLPNGDKAVFTYGATMDLMIARELLENCVQASEILGIDPEFRAKCEAALAKLAPIRVNPETGRIYEWIDDYKETDPTHRHTSHLYGLYPGTSISLATPELMEAARKVLDRRGDAGTGWGLAWKIAMWTRLRDGDHAYKLLRVLLEEKTYPNLFDSHAPFQIDGNFGATAAIAEMVMQSQTPAGKGAWEIDLLPALPSVWKDGTVAGLRARGGVTVDVAWKGGQLHVARLTADRAGTYRVRLGKTVKEIPLEAGKTVALNAALAVQ